MRGMQGDKTPGFLQAFFGSFLSFSKYPEYSKRSSGSIFGHYLLVIVLCCSLYAVFTSAWLNTNVSPYLDDFAESVPTFVVKDGQAELDVPQPYFFEIEGTKVGVVDTTQPPEVYLSDEQYQDFVIVSKESFSIKQANAKTETHKFQGDFSIDSQEVSSWIDTLESWFLPGTFLICFAWQFCWKACQVVVVAAVVTLIQQSRPGFSNHLKLAVHALGPAMIFGVLVYAASLAGVILPGAGLIFWGILGGLTWYGSEKQKNTPEYS